MSELLPIELRCQPPGTTATAMRIGSGVRRELGAAIGNRRAFALVDRVVSENSPELLAPGWPRVELEAGEGVKTFSQLEQVLRAMVREGLDRSAVLVAVGGGTIGDLGGLAASLFLRGVELVMVPTTLLAMLDSCIGGKTAINLPEGKNLVGTTHPASLVLADLDFLATLTELEFRSGLGEALKMGIGLHEGLFLFLEQERDPILARDPGALQTVVRYAIEGKIEVVESDLKESGSRRLLNLGHSLGHALEAHSDGAIAHGVAVARGLHFAIEVAVALDGMAPEPARRCVELLRFYGFDRDPVPSADELMPFLSRDKKMAGGALQMALPTAVGRSETRPVSLEALRDLLNN